MCLHKQYNSYTTDKLAEFRSSVSHKICFRKQLTFLKYRGTLTQSLSNRITVRSQFFRAYKDLRSYYVSILRANFCEKILPRYSHYVFKNFNSKDFLIAFSQHLMMYDLDYALMWRGVQTNSLFNVRSQRVKRRKKEYFYRHRVFFITGYKRLLFVWRWLSVIIRSTNVKNTHRKFGLLPSMENFLFTPDSSQFIHLFKLHVYRLKLIRVL